MNGDIKCQWCGGKEILKRKKALGHKKDSKLSSILFTMNVSQDIGSMAPIQPILHTQAGCWHVIWDTDYPYPCKATP